MSRIRRAYFWPSVIVIAFWFALASWVSFVGWRVAMGPEAYTYPNIEASQ